MSAILVNRNMDLLFEQDGAEAGVESAQALGSGDLAEAAQEASGECRFRHKTDSGGLQRAQSNVGEELSGSR